LSVKEVLEYYQLELNILCGPNLWRHQLLYFKLCYGRN